MLRLEVLNDQGYSRLKTKALDMITNLRLQADILNAKKNGAADQHVYSGI